MVPGCACRCCFDTGADSLVLHPDYEIIFSNLQPQKYKGIASADTYDGKKTIGKIEIFGRVIECEIGLVAMEFLPWRVGLRTYLFKVFRLLLLGSRS
jgi:hypothetical protein